MAEDNPFTKFAKPGTSAKGSDNPFDKFKRPEEDRNYQSREVATLPEPHPNMFAGMRRMVRYIIRAFLYLVLREILERLKH